LRDPDDLELNLLLNAGEYTRRILPFLLFLALAA
jgi:hypothetical protein